MNQSQFLSLVKTLLGAAGGFAVAKGWTDASTVTTLTGAAVMVAPLVWGLLSHTALANAETAAATPGVTIKVGPDAPPSLKAAAADPAVPAITKV